ncbi:hypothetical protein ACFYZ5_39485 [Streptomyces chartreusis]|uniref:hypothetical protein n=1 Tax=Streptomyces chartreusis TaxID=1969 RepID=UPI0036A2A4F7
MLFGLAPFEDRLFPPAQEALTEAVPDNEWRTRLASVDLNAADASSLSAEPAVVEF